MSLCNFLGAKLRHFVNISKGLLTLWVKENMLYFNLYILFPKYIANWKHFGVKTLQIVSGANF